MWDLSRRIAMQYQELTAMILWSTLFELLQAFDFPHATFRAAGLALEPRLRLTTHIARQEIAAKQSAFSIGGSKWSDVAAGPGLRILPRDAAIPTAARAPPQRPRVHKRGLLPKARQSGSNLRRVSPTRFAQPARRPFRTSNREEASSRPRPPRRTQRVR